MNREPDNCRATGNVQYYFPRSGQKSEKRLIRLINSAVETLDILIFNMTDKEVFDAVLGSKRRGVDIRLITDKTMLLNPRQHRFMRKFKAAGIPVKKNIHRGFMHLKTVIKDRQIVATGSANFTKSSQSKNDEVLILFDGKRVADDFTKQFNRMWKDTENYADF